MSYYISTLPTFGTLVDKNNNIITTVPYKLQNISEVNYMSPYISEVSKNDSFQYYYDNGFGNRTNIGTITVVIYKRDIPIKAVSCGPNFQIGTFSSNITLPQFTDGANGTIDAKYRLVYRQSYTENGISKKYYSPPNGNFILSIKKSWENPTPIFYELTNNISTKNSEKMVLQRADGYTNYTIWYDVDELSVINQNTLTFGNTMLQPQLTAPTISSIIKITDSANGNMNAYYRLLLRQGIYNYSAPADKIHKTGDSGYEKPQLRYTFSNNVTTLSDQVLVLQRADKSSNYRYWYTVEETTLNNVNTYTFNNTQTPNPTVTSISITAVKYPGGQLGTFTVSQNDVTWSSSGNIDAKFRVISKKGMYNYSSVNTANNDFNVISSGYKKPSLFYEFSQNITTQDDERIVLQRADKVTSADDNTANYFFWYDVDAISLNNQKSFLFINTEGPSVPFHVKGMESAQTGTRIGTITVGSSITNHTWSANGTINAQYRILYTKGINNNYSYTVPLMLAGTANVAIITVNSTNDEPTIFVEFTETYTTTGGERLILQRRNRPDNNTAYGNWFDLEIFTLDNGYYKRLTLT